ncbi:hypothetical protein GQ54DRAFT_69563 [Martensiomyces pterosporus]|nr:hypothetical protein GQ54DRAFT_69563 [Martensiomyces pterosporus]
MLVLCIWLCLIVWPPFEDHLCLFQRCTTCLTLEHLETHWWVEWWLLSKAGGKAGCPQMALQPARQANSARHLPAATPTTHHPHCTENHCCRQVSFSKCDLQGARPTPCAMCYRIAGWTMATASSPCVPLTPHAVSISTSISTRFVQSALPTQSPFSCQCCHKQHAVAPADICVFLFACIYG